MALPNLGGHSKGGTITEGQDTKEVTSNDLDALIDVVGTMDNSQRKFYRMELHDILILSESGLAYTTRAQLRTRLGI